MAFAVPGENSLIDCINPNTGLSWIERENLDQVRKRYPKAEIVNIDDWCQQKAARQDTPITWSEVTEDRYMEMLEVLPPAIMTRAGFLVGEPWDHHATTGQPRYAAFMAKMGKYYEASRPMTIKEFKSL